MIEKLDTRKGSIESKDPLGSSIPGMSLTSENKKWAWGNPPLESDPKLVLEQAVDNQYSNKIRSNEDRINAVKTFRKI